MHRVYHESFESNADSPHSVRPCHWVLQNTYAVRADALKAAKLIAELHNVYVKVTTPRGAWAGTEYICCQRNKNSPAALAS